MTRPFLWFGRRLALVSLAIAGAGIALLLYGNVGQARLSDGADLGLYTYPSSDCHEADLNAGDPINVVFYDEADKPSLDYYFYLYNHWADNGGTTQYFKTHGLCHVMDGQPSSRGAGYSRYHARYARGRTSSGGVDGDPSFGDYSLAAAHYENYDVGGGCGLGNHWVPEGGFNDGRDNVIENWVTSPSPGHTLWGYEYWGNTLGRTKCNGTVARSDGRVAFIRAYLDSDGDGCTDPKELSMGFNPNAWYDFYDVPTPSLRADPGGTRNRAVNGGDVLAVNSYSGTREGQAAYEADVNGNTIRDGLEYDRSVSPAPNPPYDAGPPNGAISASDVLVANKQVGLRCDR